MRELPETIRIVGMSWTITLCHENEFGRFDCKTRSIFIDHTSDVQRQWQILIHEIQEIIMVERGFCYKPYLDTCMTDDRMFVMNHKEFRSLGKDFADVFRQLLGV